MVIRPVLGRLSGLVSPYGFVATRLQHSMRGPKKKKKKKPKS